MLKDFKEFAIKGNVIDMAVGIIIGAAFGGIVTSLVNDVIMPPIGFLLGKVDFANIFFVIKDGKVPGPYETLAAAKTAGAVTMNVGLFINTMINFVLVAFAVFMLVRNINRLKKAAVPAPAAETATKECPHCFSTINSKATRCAHCTASL